MRNLSLRRLPKPPGPSPSSIARKRTTLAAETSRIEADTMGADKPLSTPVESRGKGTKTNAESFLIDTGIGEASNWLVAQDL
jgi:hypothetical protein